MSKTKHMLSEMWAEADFERWFRGKFGRWNPRRWLRGVCLDAWMMAEKRQEEEIERLRADRESLLEYLEAEAERWADRNADRYWQTMRILGRAKKQDDLRIRELPKWRCER